MRQIRIHVSQPLAPGTELALNDGAAEHVSRVLRMRTGDTLVLFNGDGRDYPATLTQCERREVRAHVDDAVDVDTESPLRLVLAQALVSGSKMDLVIQKAVELGVHAIVPLATERGTVQLDERRAEKRLAHWQGVVVSACEQCGRSTLPQVASVQPLSGWCASLMDDEALRLALIPGTDQRVRDLALGKAGAVLVVGPEGGLSAGDVQTLESAGFSGLALGPRILRTETAGLAALAALQSRFGDL
ncbi:MAG: 16S rRNA (uracil(1498)-N(3))-methyltransferase [Rhodanobacteraceae bacterium]